MSIARDFVDNAGKEAWIIDFFDRHIVMVVYGPKQNEEGVHPINADDRLAAAARYCRAGGGDELVLTFAEAPAPDMACPGAALTG